MLLVLNGNIHDGYGNVLNNADMLIDGGLIKEIGRGLENPGCDTIDAAGKEIFPGFIEACTRWGAIGPHTGDNDMNEHTSPVNPELDAVYAFDPDGMLFQRAYEYGLSAAALVPSFGNVLGGQAAVFKTHGNHPYKMLVKQKAAVAASVSKLVKRAGQNTAMTRMGMIYLLDEALTKAASYDENGDYDPKSKALKPVLEGRVPLFIHAENDAEMDAVELLMNKYPEVRCVFCGAITLNKHRRSVASGRYQVVFADMVARKDNIKIQYTDVQQMIEGGSKLALGNCRANGGSKETLLWNAVLSYKNGMDAECSLRMITSLPAEILGVSDVIGSLSAGKHADLSIWSDNPITTYRARLEHMFVDGVNVLDGKAEVKPVCW